MVNKPTDEQRIEATQMGINLIPTSNAEHLAGILSKNSDFHIRYIEKNKDGKKVFPDGEIYINISRFDEGKTVVLHSGAPSPNDGIVELEFILGMLKERQINNVELFITYFPYGKQDLAFLDGEINIAETLIKRWINCYGIKKIYIIDAHFKGREWVDKYPIEHIFSVNIIKKAALNKYPGIFFVAPDAGSARRNKLRGFLKKRNSSYNIEISCDENFGKSINGKIVGVIDDMIETGGTMVGVCKKCKELGALKVIALVTHGVLESGTEKIKNIYDDLFLTNTIRRDGANVDVSNLIADSLQIYGQNRKNN